MIGDGFGKKKKGTGTNMFLGLNGPGFTFADN
jgi:hypothetical protein